MEFTGERFTPECVREIWYEHFHRYVLAGEFASGKRVLDEFFSRHVRQSGMSKEIFVYGCAKEASKRQSVSAFVETLFETLGITSASQEAAQNL